MSMKRSDAEVIPSDNENIETRINTDEDGVRIVQDIENSEKNEVYLPWSEYDDATSLIEVQLERMLLQHVELIDKDLDGYGDAKLYRLDTAIPADTIYDENEEHEHFTTRYIFVGTKQTMLGGLGKPCGAAPYNKETGHVAHMSGFEANTKAAALNKLLKHHRDKILNGDNNDD